MGRGTYFGFAVDWFIVSTAVASCYVVFITAALIYLGLCLYIKGMVMDMKAQLRCLRSAEKMNQANRWAIYLKEITFHNEIIQ